MKYSITLLCILCIGCATMGTNIPKKHEEICPGITSESPDVREDAALHCKDKYVLFDVAKCDESPEVRVAASKRIMDIKIVIKLYKYVETDDALTDSQKKKFRTYLKKKFNLLNECPGVGYTDVKKRKSEISKCKSDLLKVFVARHDFDDEVRLYAAGEIANIEKLKSLWPYIKNDETLSAEMKEKFQQRMKSRAKALAKMTRGPSGEPAPSKSYDYDFNNRDKDGNPIEKQAQDMSGGYDTNGDEPDIANLLQSDAETVGSKVSKMIKICYERILKYSPTTRGKIEVFVHVEEGGNVSKTSILLDEVHNDRMNKCILSNVKNTKFNFVEKSGGVIVPALLTPGI